MITTWSKFIYGTDITLSNCFGDFQEGAIVLAAQLVPGSRTLGELIDDIETAFNLVGGQIYTVALDRATNRVTISAAANFSLLIHTGNNKNSAFWSLLGFADADLSGANTYTGTLAAAFTYYPQFLLQSYVPPENYQMSRDPKVNKSCTGRTELVRFGIDQMTKFELKFITNRLMDGVVIKNNPTGVADVNSFFRFISSKCRFEFVPDMATPGTLYKVILESNESDKDGSGFMLKELFMQNLPGIFESGIIILRVVT